MRVKELSKVLSVDSGSSKADLNYIAKIERAISDRFSEILVYTNWLWRRSSEIITTVIDQDTYKLSTSAMQPLSGRITGTGKRRITYRPLDDLVEAGLRDDSVGTPIYYSHGGFDANEAKMQIIFTPVPNQVFTVEFQTELVPTVLTSESVIPVPADIIPLLKKGVMYDIVSDPNKSAVLRAEFYSSLEVARKRYSKTEAFKPVRQISTILNGEGGWPPPDPRFG